MSKPANQGVSYYIITGKNRATGRYEMLFGDYDRELVYTERDDMVQSPNDAYHFLRVRRVSDDQQQIDHAVKSLNL